MSKRLIILSELRYRDFAPCLWRITRDFVWVYGGRPFRAPEGFVLDFYSIPWFLRWFRQQNQGTHNAPALIHDYLVRNRKLLDLSLMDCHRQFRAAMRAVGVNPVVRAVKYAAVVAFNWTVAGPGDGTAPRGVQEATDAAAGTIA